MIDKKSWKEFRETGLLFAINQFLHFFGYSIVYSFDGNGEIEEVYPARVKYRGFGNKRIGEGYKKVSRYIMQNAVDLEKESEM